MIKLFAKALGMRYWIVEISVLAVLITVSAILISSGGVAFEAPMRIPQVDSTTYVIYNPSSSLVFTGVIPSELLAYLENSSSTLVMSPEVASLAIFYGKSIMVRGVEAESFLKITKPKMIVGVFEVGESKAVVGEDLARSFHIRLGETIVLYSFFTNRSLALYVTGIVENDVISSEVIVGLDDARYLRGLNEDQFSYIRVLPHGENDLKLLSSLSSTVEASSGKVNIPAWLLSLIKNSQISSSISGYSTRLSKNMESVERASIISALLTALILSIVAAYALSSAIVKSQATGLRLLWRLGMSKSEVIKRFILIKSISSFISSIVGFGFFLFLYFSGKLTFSFLYHSLRPSFDALYLLSYIALLASGYIVSAWKNAKVLLYEES
jgi:hypothetical protein|uniref:FtsX-like permease family protein n=1 Tax=Fervidicoccus fontis TaxID=683846 RepID=A0A7J3SLF9_9CREN